MCVHASLLNMNFDQHKFDKIQESLERQRDDFAREYICEIYSASEVSQITSEQKSEVEEFMESSDCPDFWVAGFSSVINDWEGENL